LPGIPLRLTDLVVVDADTREAVEEMRALRMLGPHSKIATPSGGLHLVFAQPAERIGKFRWSEGIEILGTSSLLTIYDVEELKFPRVAPRAVLPEMFRRPREECGFRVEDGFIVRGSSVEAPNKASKKKTRAVIDTTPPVAVAGLVEALWELDPVDWRGDYFGWFALLTAAQWLGQAFARSCASPKTSFSTWWNALVIIRLTSSAPISRRSRGQAPTNKSRATDCLGFFSSTIISPTRHATQNNMSRSCLARSRSRRELKRTRQSPRVGFG
jgi:hypothetical protein